MSSGDLSRPPSPYLQIADHYRQLILSGDLAPGHRLPTAADLAAQWGVAPRTVHKAMTQLQGESLIEMSRGRGTRVAQHEQAHTSRRRLDSFRETGRIYPSNERAQIIAATTCAVPDHIAVAMGAHSDAVVVRRDRLTLVNDQPVTFSTSWLPGEFAQAAPRLLETARIVEGTFGYIEAVTGRAVADVREQYAGGQASEGAAGQLGVEVGAAVLLKRSWFIDADGDVIEFGESTTIAGRWVAPRGQ